MEDAQVAKKSAPIPVTQPPSQTPSMSLPRSLLVKEAPVHGWTRTITVRVGPAAFLTTKKGYICTNFTVHEHILRAHSPFFSAALNHQWKEAQERLVNLPDHKPADFEIYLHWIYSHTIPAPKPTPSPKSGSECSGIHRLIGAYILGDVLQDGDFRDALLDAIADIATTKRVHMRNFLTRIYSSTVVDDPLRRLAIDSCAFGCGDDWFVNGRKKDNVPSEALWDIIARMHKAKGVLGSKLAPFKLDMCPYHVHQSGVCYKVRFANQFGARNVLAKDTRTDPASGDKEEHTDTSSSGL